MAIPWGGIALLGAGLLGQKLMTPKQPKMPKYNYTPVSQTMDQIDPGWQTREAELKAGIDKSMVELEDRVAQMDKAASVMDQQAGRLAAMGDVLMSGEIPEETKDQLEMLAAERAWQGGFGTSERASNTTARDLGLYSLDLINQGRSYTKDAADITSNRSQLHNAGSQILSQAQSSNANILANYSSNRAQTAAQLAISNANQAFEAYSLKVNADMAKWQTKVNSNNSLWSGLIQGGTMFAMAGGMGSQKGSTGGSSSGGFWSGLRSSKTPAYNPGPFDKPNFYA